MINRRSFLAAMGAGCTLAAKSNAQRGGQLFSTVETTNGKVQGIANTGIKEFKGIPYGAPTGGKNRYMPPRKPAAWSGVRECFGHGQISPQTLSNLAGDYGMMIQWDLQSGGMGEDCLSLNVWTPGVNDGGKRAVMVSFQWRRLRHRIGQRTGIRRRAIGAVRRCGGGDGEPPPGQPRLSRPGRFGRAAGICAGWRRRHDGPGSVARMGAR